MKAAHPEMAVAPRANPGETLRNARESKGWAVADVAAQLNLTPQRLSQVEAGEFDQLPGHTFARGYVRAYAKLLGLDQASLVHEFDQFTGSDAVGASVHSLGHIEEPVSYSSYILRGVSVLLLVGLAGAGYFWWQEQADRRAEHISTTSLGHVEVEGADGTIQIHPLEEPEDQAVEEAQVDVQNLPLPLLDAQPNVAGAELGVEAASQSVAPAPAVTAGSVAPTATAGTEQVAIPAVPSVTAPTQPATSAVSQTVTAAQGDAHVGVNFTADCWTQITDAKGKVLFSGLKRKGDNLQVAGKAPLELRLGYARGAQVSVNGAAFDIAPFVSGETARIKLGGQ